MMINRLKGNMFMLRGFSIFYIVTSFTCCYRYSNNNNNNCKYNNYFVQSFCVDYMRQGLNVAFYVYSNKNSKHLHGGLTTNYIRYYEIYIYIYNYLQ